MTEVTLGVSLPRAVMSEKEDVLKYIRELRA
jgi:hypothetical protein